MQETRGLAIMFPPMIWLPVQIDFDVLSPWSGSVNAAPSRHWIAALDSLSAAFANSCERMSPSSKAAAQTSMDGPGLPQAAALRMGQMRSAPGGCSKGIYVQRARSHAV